MLDSRLEAISHHFVSEICHIQARVCAEFMRPPPISDQASYCTRKRNNVSLPDNQPVASVTHESAGGSTNRVCRDNGEVCAHSLIHYQAPRLATHGGGYRRKHKAGCSGQAAGKFIVIGVRRGPSLPPAAQVNRGALLAKYRTSAGIAVAALETFPPQAIDFFRHPQTILRDAPPTDTTTLPVYVYVNAAGARTLP